MAELGIISIFRFSKVPIMDMYFLIFLMLFFFNGQEPFDTFSYRRLEREEREIL